MVMLILVVLAVFVAPKFWGSEFEDAGLKDETAAALRYAQRAALAMQRSVCMQFTATSITFRYASAYGSAVCDTDLPPPGGGPVPYQVTGRGAAAFSPTPTDFSYDRVGRPSVAQTITVSGGGQVVVEAESGYVH